MGALCSRSEPVEEIKGPNQQHKQQHSQNLHQDSKRELSHPGFMARRSQRIANQSRNARMKEQQPAPDPAALARNYIQAHDAEIAGRDIILTESSTVTQESGPVGDYFRLRQNLVTREKALDFDHDCRIHSTPEERRADIIIQQLRRNDEETVYAQAAPRTGYGGQLHPRFPGDHFLSNKDLIDQTSLFKVAQRMPKGSHLHIHFNACLAPQVLLNLAKEMDRMFIMSDVPLVSDNNHINFDRCEIQFSLLSRERAKKSPGPGDLFSRDYKPRQTMPFKDFLNKFPGYYTKDSTSVDEWLFEKLMFHEEEAHNHLQTASG